MGGAESSRNTNKVKLLKVPKKHILLKCVSNRNKTKGEVTQAKKNCDGKKNQG